MAKLNNDWQAQKQEVQRNRKLDEHFLQLKAQPPHQGLPFFFQISTEVSKSWKWPFSSHLLSPTVHEYASIMGFKENDYGMMPRVEETLAAYLSPDAASSLKGPTLPTKPCRATSLLVYKAYVAAG